MKNTRISVIVLASLVIPGTLAQADVLSGPIVNPSNGHQYYLLGASTWTDAETAAVSLGGHLATVRSKAENDWILAEFGSLVPSPGTLGLWIGLHDPVGNDGNGAQHAANFIWSSGELVTYRYWGAGEPNNTGGEYYTQMVVKPHHSLLPGEWNDTYDNDWPGSQDCGVVEVLPATIAITSVTPDPSTVGQAVTIAYSIVGTFGGTPTGDVTVGDGTDSCTAPVGAGHCEITFSSSGNKTLTATYSGDAAFNSSTSAPVSHTVWAAPSNPNDPAGQPMALASPCGCGPGMTLWMPFTLLGFRVLQSLRPGRWRATSSPNR